MKGILGLAAFGGLWELLPRLGVVPAQWAPPLSRVVTALLAEAREPRFWAAVRDTLLTWALGLGIAVVAGIVIGVVIGSVPVLRAATASTIEFLRPIPSVALIPLVVVLYGVTMTSTLVLVVYASFWQVLIQVLHGVADVDPVARDTASIYHLPKVRYLYWPTALPYIATGVRLAASVALILTVTGELVINSPGLGHQIALAQLSGAVPQMYALILVAGLIGVAANLLARFAERRALAWHPSVRGEVPV